MHTDVRVSSTRIPMMMALLTFGAAAAVAQPPPLLVWYLGNVNPAAPDSAGPGVSFTLFDGVELGELVYDPDALNFTSWRVLDDSQSAKCRYRSTATTIDCATGATILGRVRVPSQQGAKGTSLAFYDDADGGTAGYFWGGAGATPGLIQESYRAVELSIPGDANYHILRMTLSGGSANCPGVDRVLNFYFDENPTPVMTISPAADASDVAVPQLLDYFGFGASNTNGRITIHFDWVTATNQGAFAPGEEVAVLGQSLVPTGLPACALNVVPANVQTAAAVQGQPATPAQISFTALNAGQSTLNSYTVTKVPDDATTAWLTFDRTSGGPLSSGGTDTIIASINTAGLAKGVRSVDLHFTSNDCVPPSQVVRRVELTVSGSLEVTPAPGFSVPAEPATPKTRAFTVTNVGGSDLTYTVAKLDTCDWLTLDKTGGGPIPPLGTDTVTVTVDPTGITEDQSCQLRFSNTGETVDRTVTVDVLESPLVLSYGGEVRPDAPDSFGPGYTFTLSGLADMADQGSLVDDPAALDGKAWRIEDDNTHRTRWESAPNTPIDENRGATIVGRVAVESIAGNLRPDNLLIRENSGLSASVHFSGPHSTTQRMGRVSEALRAIDSLANPAKANSNYHILRMSVIGGPTTGMGRTIRIYMDEADTPVLELLDASPETNAGDDFGFGAVHVAVAQTIKFDYVRATTAGAFAPGEEAAVIGESLVLPEPGPCCLPDQTCEMLMPDACDAAGGAYQGIGETCETIGPCPFICHRPAADADNDDDVDSADFAEFQRCLGPLAADPGYCQCFDRGDDNGDGEPEADGDIDVYDLNVFLSCGSGPSVPADPNCGN